MGLEYLRHLVFYFILTPSLITASLVHLSRNQGKEHIQVIQKEKKNNSEYMIIEFLSSMCLVI